jgi:hypothetical protein
LPDGKYLIPLPVRGELDTADPIGDRPPGTLVEAKDVSARFWGPRTGSKAFTRVWEGPGTASLYDEITLLGTNSVAGISSSYETQYRDLGTTFTLDIWFRLDETAYASAATEIGLYTFNSGGIGVISVGIHGGAAGANASKILVAIDTSATRSSAAATVSLTSSTAITAGTAQTDKHHLRITRDGATLTIYVDGSEDGVSTGLSASNPINSALSGRGQAIIGNSLTSDISLKGVVFAAVLRDGSYSTLPIEGTMPHSPWGGNVHHYLLGRSIDFGGGEDHYFDAGRFAAHARLQGASSADWSVSAANDDTAPAPAIVQGFQTWTTRTNRTATSALVGGVLTTSTIS